MIPSGTILPYDQICEMVAGAGYDGMAIDLGAGDVAQAREVRPHMERNGLTPLIVAFPKTGWIASRNLDHGQGFRRTLRRYHRSGDAA